MKSYLKRNGAGVLFIMLVVAFVGLAPLYAQAAPVGGPVAPDTPLTLNTNCGTEGVGKLPGWRPGENYWKGKAATPSNIFDELNNPVWETAAVNSEGNWFWCHGWIKPGEPPTTVQPDNRPCPGGTGAVATWTVNGKTCTSFDPQKTSPTDPSRVQGRAAGEFQAFKTIPGRFSGVGIFQCKGAKFEQQSGSWCQEEAQCGGTVTLSWGTNAACGATASTFLGAGKTMKVANTSFGYTGEVTLSCNPTTLQFQTVASSCVKK